MKLVSVQIDCSAAERFLAYVDGDGSISSVWNHPGYEVVRAHATLLGRELTADDVSGAVAGEETGFSGVECLAENRDEIVRLLDHVRANESAWTDLIDRHLRRVTPDADTSDVTIHLGVGYDVGIGIADGAYLNVNEPLFYGRPRQLLYTAIHESSHVVYERAHGAIASLGPDPFTSADQRDVWNTVVHTEAYATYAPLELRRSDGNVGECDHPICEDYGVLADESRMRALVEEYDSFRKRLRRESVPRKTLFARLFGGSRLPYRVGCALVTELERTEGMAAVREAFHADPATFPEEYGWALNRYRTDDGLDSSHG